MKTKWGACKHRAGNIRLNTELVKKPRHLLEYVIVHEMAHLLEPTHNDHFVATLLISPISSLFIVRYTGDSFQPYRLRCPRFVAALVIPTG